MRGAVGRPGRGRAARGLTLLGISQTPPVPEASSQSPLKCLCPLPPFLDPPASLLGLADSEIKAGAKPSPQTPSWSGVCSPPCSWELPAFSLGHPESPARTRRPMELSTGPGGGPQTRRRGLLFSKLHVCHSFIHSANTAWKSGLVPQRAGSGVPATDMPRGPHVGFKMF